MILSVMTNVREHPVGGQKAIYGSICHVPVDVAPTVSSLPHNMQETNTVSVKIKCKHSYKHHVLAENNRPRKVLEALHYLLENSTMFQNENVQIDADWMTKLLMGESNAPSSVTHDELETAAIQVTQDQIEITQSDVTSSSTVDTTDATSMLSVKDEDGDDNDDQEREEDGEPDNAPSTNTMLHDKDIDSTNTTLTFVPGDGKRPIFQEPLAEYLCFPTIFCGQECAPNSKRISPLQQGDIFKYELCSVDTHVTSNIPNIFWKAKHKQVKQICDKVSLAVCRNKTKGKK